jgi:hypothetical protein
MKIKYLVILSFCALQFLPAQVLKIYKADNSTVDFNLSDIDSVRFSASAAGSAIASSDWVCLTNGSALLKTGLTAGIYEETDEGLKIYGSSGGATQLTPAAAKPIVSGTIYLKWKLNGNGKTVNLGVELFTGAGLTSSAGKAFSASSGSGLYKEDTWYFTRITVLRDKVTAVTSAYNYDCNGGEIIAVSAIEPNSEPAAYSFQAEGGKQSYVIIAEARIE